MDRFTIYDDEVKSVLQLVKKLGNIANDKTDINGDHKGSWQGLNRPTMSEEGMRATVEKLNEETLPTIEKILLNKEYDVKNLPSPLVSAKGDGVTDDIIAIQRAIDYISENGGGKLYLPKGEYLITNTIYLKNNVRLVGQGDTISIIRIPLSANIDAINMGWSVGSEVSHLGIIYPTKSVTGTSSIKIPSNTTGNGLVIGSANASEHVSLSTNKVHHLKIIGCPNNGILINSRVWVIDFNNFHIRECGEAGIRNNSSDNSFSDIYVFNCLYGIYDAGANNKFYKAKLIFSGMAYGRLNSNVYGISAGYRGNGSTRTTLDGVECQDNAGHGFIFLNCKDYNINCLSDGNGRQSADLSLAKEGIGYAFWGTSSNFIGSITATNYHTDKPQLRGVSIAETCSNINLNYNSSEQVEADEIKGTKINLNSSLQWIKLETSNTSVSGRMLQCVNNGLFDIDLSINLTTPLSANTIATITSNIKSLKSGTRCQVPCIFESTDGATILGQGILIIDSKGFRVISPAAIASGCVIKACN